MSPWRIQLALCAVMILVALFRTERLHLPAPAMAAEASSGEALEPERSFDELILWLKEFRAHSQELHDDPSEEERVEHLRALSFLLADRTLFQEADRFLTSALEAESAPREESFGDSLQLAEFRMEAGRVKESLNIVQRLSIQDKSPEVRQRVAVLHARGGAHFAALGILEELMPRLPAEMKLLRARCLWESGSLEEALRAADELSSEAGLSNDILQSLVLLRADCLYGLGRWKEAEEVYEKAKRSEVSPEKAAWIRFQLGNLAHREQRWRTARALYGEAAESWPRTFYGMQSEWFLRTTERIARLSTRGSA
jgi:tetratricopeptide (TPR) repeat protein